MNPNTSAATTASTRLETDLLGPLEVPAEAYYGVHTVRAVDNFPISGRTVGDIPALIQAYALVKKAAAGANRELGALRPELAEPIEAACDRLIGETSDLAAQFPVDLFQGGAGTSVNMNVNEVIANLALESLGEAKGRYDLIDPNDHVNMSQSTNDTYPTALRLALLMSLDGLADALRRLQASFARKGEEFADIPTMGRTQLQDAVPMRLGQEFTAFAVLIEEELKHLASEAALLVEVNLGATAIGTGVTAPPGYAERAVARLAAATGRPFVISQDLVEATSDCGAYVSLHGALKRSAVKLSKIANDLRLLSSGPRTALREINLPERQAGSSIMPAKVNPVIPEVVNQIAFKVIGNDLVVTLAAEAGQLQLNAMEPVIAQSCFESIQLLRAGCETLGLKCIDGITANPEVTRAYVRDSIGLVTFLAPVLGHRLCDEIGQEAEASGRSIRQVVEDRGLLDQATLDRLLPPCG
ncbi:MAG: aspartate ammonia-lyase [Bifidobacteriaceae bacterium]|jgi:aspartate ammonia-lyase|nr:aspartate ammonia-lyase [Bifidobacteriaceae bacterium]